MSYDKWKYHTIDAYKQIENDIESTGLNKWEICPECNEKPRVWLFDNGRHAKCCCGKLYEEAPARAESVMSVYIRCNGSTTEYYPDDLRIAWNKFIETKSLQNKLPAGRW